MAGFFKTAGPVLIPVLLLPVLACQREMAAGVEADGAIRFETVDTKAGDHFAPGDDFRVWAEADDGEPVMAGQKVILTEEGWRYSPVKYWPDGKSVTFLAAAPAAEEIIRRPPVPADILEIHLPEGADADVLIAPRVTETAGNTVKFNFRHILSRVSIFAKARRKAPESKVIRIREIQIGPFLSTGTWAPEMMDWEDTNNPALFCQQPAAEIADTVSTPLTDFFLIPDYGTNDSRLIVSWEIVNKSNGTASFSKTDTISLAGKSFLKNTSLGITLAVDGRTDLIDFQDPRTKALCVSRFDTDADGEISYSEAASVKSLGSLFMGKNIQLFHELQYFTGLTKIEAGGFSHCVQLREITLPEGISEIGESAFESCQSLTGIQLPHSITRIGSYAFSRCSNLRGIDLYWFSGTLGERVFMSDSRLTYIRWPSSLRTIPKGTFQGCTAIERLDFFFTNVALGDEAFRGCTGLKEVDISQFDRVGDYAFSECSGITTVNFSPVTTLDGRGIFYKCSNISWISFGPYLAIIPAYTFYGCTHIGELELPEHLAFIDGYAFYGCTGLSELDLPKDVSRIGSMSFAGCSDIRRIISRPKTAPETENDSFGTGDLIAGSAYTGSKTLRVLFTSSGYNKKGWSTLTDEGGFKRSNVFVF